MQVESEQVFSINKIFAREVPEPQKYSREKDANKKWVITLEYIFLILDFAGLFKGNDNNKTLTTAIIAFANYILWTW